VTPKDCSENLAKRGKFFSSSVKPPFDPEVPVSRMPEFATIVYLRDWNLEERKIGF
jgi:hypothetical protein